MLLASYAIASCRILPLHVLTLYYREASRDRERRTHLGRKTYVVDSLPGRILSFSYHILYRFAVFVLITYMYMYMYMYHRLFVAFRIANFMLPAAWYCVRFQSVREVGLVEAGCCANSWLKTA